MLLKQRMEAASVAMVIFLASPIGAGTQQKSDPPISTTLCEILAAPDSYHGKLVHFRARYGGTWEGMYFSDPKCEKSHPEGQNVIVFQTVEMFDALKVKIPKSARALKFVDDKGSRDFARASKQLCNAMRECRYDYIEADFNGVVIVKSGYRIKDGWGNGFGQIGYTKTALVWQSIADVAPHPCKYGKGDCV